MLFAGLLIVTLLEKNSFTGSFQRIAEISRSIFYNLCYKEHISINWRSLNSTTKKTQHVSSYRQKKLSEKQIKIDKEQ